MIGLKYVGYKESKVEKREISIGELRHRLTLAYTKKPESTFILLTLDDGQRLELHSMEEALDFEWHDDCRVEIINLPHKWGVLDDLGNMEEGAPTIIILQLAAEEETDKTVL